MTVHHSCNQAVKRLDKTKQSVMHKVQQWANTLGIARFYHEQRDSWHTSTPYPVAKVLDMCGHKTTAWLSQPGTNETDHFLYHRT